MWQAGAAAAARPRADLQFMSPRSLQENLVTTQLLQHQDQELEHNNGKVAAERQEEERRVTGNKDVGCRNNKRAMKRGN